MQEAENNILQEEWVRKYGPNLKYHGFFNLTRLYTTDTKVLNHFLTNNYIYQKPEHTRYNLSQIVGTGTIYSVV
ncbi:hypothetical protein B0H13DRAFT_1591452 [Mycena leptocephala]|nr:hypothetical protein B0H13DRAFT_1591452 [Mycena leptocephala]